MSAKASTRNRDTVRINLEVSPQVREQIKHLREQSSATTLAEVFRKSLALYEMVLDHTQDGGKLVLENENGDREVIRIL